MSKAEKITYEQIAAAADAITASGKKPTFDAVRERIGGGSFTTIHKHLVAWREAQPVKVKQSWQLPDVISEVLYKVFEQTSAEARADLEQKLIESSSELASLSAENTKLDAENEILAEQLLALTTERDRLAGKAELQEKDIAESREKVKNLEAAAESARLEIATSRLRAESLIENDVARKKEIEKLYEDVARLQDAKIATERDAAVLNERVISLQKATAQDASHALAAAQAAADTIKKLEDQAAEQAKIASDRMDDMRSQLREMKIELDKSRQSEADYREKVALLRGKIVATRLFAPTPTVPQDPIAADEQSSIDAFFEKIV